MFIHKVIESIRLLSKMNIKRRKFKRCQLLSKVSGKTTYLYDKLLKKSILYGYHNHFDSNIFVNNCSYS